MKVEGKIKILIVDDTPDIVNHLQQTLLSAGYEVYVATSGSKALQRLEHTKPDLILLDIIMPDIDGYETCSRIKADPDRSAIPIIFMSALHETFDKVKAFSTGAVDYITKPLNTEELLVRIKTHISINQLQKELREANSQLEEKVQQRTNELQESEAKYRRLFEKSQEGIWVIGADNLTTLANPAIAKMLGYQPEEMIGKSLLDFMDDAGKNNAMQNIEKRKQGIAEQHDFEFIRKDGKKIFTTVETAPLIDEKGEYIGAIAGLMDITARKRIEMQLIERNEEYESLNEALRQINEALKLSKEKAEESDRLKTAFLQNMSHEIRTPMNAIIGFSELLDDSDLSPEKRKSFTTIIISSTHQLLSIVTDILTISSIDTNQEKVSIKQVCVNEIIIELLAIFKSQSFNQNISLFAQQQLTDTQSEIYTDKTKLTQILTNLLTNALKFTHEGFIEFGYRLKTDSGANELLFYVKDSGIGISEAMQDKIFERFRQADDNITRKYGGTGLGLAISKAFTELLGGKIWVESELGKGSTFYFTIPYNKVNQTDMASNQDKNTPVILAAEDEEYNYLLIEEIVRDMQYRIIHAKNGKEAVALCKTNPNIDLILMDIKMPVMDGHTAALLITEFRPELPIIALSAYALQHEIRKFSENAFDDYITKPINKNELKRKILKYLDPTFSISKV